MAVSAQDLEQIPHFDLSRWDGKSTGSTFTWRHEDYLVAVEFIDLSNTLEIDLRRTDKTLLDSFRTEPGVKPTSLEEIQRQAEQALQARYNKW